jgi:hypothetical protein
VCNVPEIDPHILLCVPFSQSVTAGGYQYKRLRARDKFRVPAAAAAAAAAAERERMATPSKDDIKKALKDNMKELKSLGSRTQDSARQITDATAALCQFPYLRPTLGVIPGGHDAAVPPHC